MPRKEIDLPYTIEYLSVLDEKGHVDKDLEPDIPDETLLNLHRTMLLSRRFDERMLTLQRQGKMGTFAPIKGQEAAQLGAAAVLDENDWLVPSFREMAAELWRGKSMEHILLVYAGYNEGCKISENMNNLPVAIPVATQIPHAVGIAYGIRYRNEKQVVMVFFGDGATSEGDFHEALNFAGVFNTPVIFVCQNNQWAISIPRSHQTQSRTLAQKAMAYGFTGIQVDGNDILAVYAAAKEAAEKARSGKGPTLIECVTYRLSVHTTADNPKRYRSDKEVKEWEKRDPVTRFQNYLIDKDLLDEDRIETLEKEIRDEIKENVEKLERTTKKPASPLAMFDHVFARTPPYLEEQKEELEREMEHNKKGKTHG
ncbi:MAG: pyruvate dehydrogenase (acetyl-transferring) E1 component subunit alpha [Desulfobacterales bacterium]